MGSAELLLAAVTSTRRCRTSAGSWEKLSSNGDLLTTAYYKDRMLYPYVGPNISSAIDFGDRSRDGQSFGIEDGGMPNLLFKHMEAAKAVNALACEAASFPEIDRLAAKGAAEGEPAPASHAVVCQRDDAGNGEYRLKRPWYFFGRKRLYLHWDIRKPLPVFEAQIKTHRAFAEDRRTRPGISSERNADLAPFAWRMQ
jgi:cholesterol oxidase